MDDLIDDFIAETRDMLEAIGGELVAWEANPADRERLDAIFRFVHTVKGNCGFFDLPRLETLSHAAEDALAEVRAGRRTAEPYLVSAVLAIVDRIGEIAQALQTGEAVPSGDDELLIAALNEPEIAVARRDAGEESGGEARSPMRSIRLSVDLLDRMMNGVSDMVLARNELARRLRETEADPVLEAAFDRVSACIAEMREVITRTRMQRIDNLFSGLPRMVRDLCMELGKKVSLEVDGGDVELDREMIEMIRDPLTHIIRNAIDHGIEDPEERIALGKPASGHLRVHARQSGNQILIEVADDGHGIDGDRLLKKALAAGIVDPARGETMTMQQKVALVFQPGLSTAQAVTAISGRGVGMDVVRANIERIGGIVDLDSRLGVGLRLTLRVPLTLTIIPALTVTAGGQKFALPRSAIEEIVRVRGDTVRIEALGGARIANIRGRRIARVSLAATLGIADGAVEDEQMMVVLKPAGAGVYALAVDLVHDHEELVIKPAAPPIMATGLYAGTTLADDGSPILLLDCSGIAASAGIELDREELNAPAEPVEDVREDRPPALLFRGFDGRARAVRLALVERIEDVDAAAVQMSAGRLRVTIRDAMLPLAGCEAAPEGRMRVLRLTDGTMEVAYAFREVIDIMPLAADVVPAIGTGEIGGVALMNGEQVEILDPFYLFAAYCGTHDLAVHAPLVCALPSNDLWMHNILRPILEHAGYRVLAADHAEAADADVIIMGDEGEAPDPSVAAKLLRLRATPEEGPDGSIYRYDRAGLLSALTQRAAGRREG